MHDELHIYIIFILQQIVLLNIDLANNLYGVYHFWGMWWSFSKLINMQNIQKIVDDKIKQFLWGFSIKG